MPTIEHHLEAARPLATAWDVWSDVRRLPQLSSSTVEVREAPDRLTAVGQTFVQVAKAAGRTIEVTWTVVDLVPLDHLTIESTPTLGATVRITEAVRAVGPERTCLTLTIDYRLPFGPLGRLASKVGLEKVAVREAHDVIQGVARMVEAADPVAATVGAAGASG